MNLTLHAVLCLIAIGSNVIALVRIGLGHDYLDIIPPNMAITGVCILLLFILMWRSGLLRKVPNGT